MNASIRVGLQLVFTQQKVCKSAHVRLAYCSQAFTPRLSAQIPFNFE